MPKTRKWIWSFVVLEQLLNETRPTAAKSAKEILARIATNARNPPDLQVGQICLVLTL